MEKTINKGNKSTKSTKHLLITHTQTLIYILHTFCWAIYKTVDLGGLQFQHCGVLLWVNPVIKIWIVLHCMGQNESVSKLFVPLHFGKRITVVPDVKWKTWLNNSNIALISSPFCTCLYFYLILVHYTWLVVGPV